MDAHYLKDRTVQFSYQNPVNDGLFIRKTLQWINNVLQNNEKRERHFDVPGEYVMVYRSISRQYREGIEHLNRKRRSDGTVIRNKPTAITTTTTATNDRTKLKILGVTHVSSTCCHLPTPKPNPCCQPPRPYCKNTKGDLVPCPFLNLQEITKLI